MDLDAIKAQALDLLWNPWGAALGLFGVAWWFFGMALSSDRYRRYALAFARNQNIRGSYRAYLTPILDWLDRRLSPEHVDAGRPATDWRRAWSWRLYHTCLLIAVVYPLLSLFLIWGFSGAEGRIGDLVVLEGDIAGWRRFLVLLFTCAQISIVLYSIIYFDYNKKEYIAIIIILIVFPIILIKETSVSLFISFALIVTLGHNKHPSLFIMFYILSIGVLGDDYSMISMIFLMIVYIITIIKFRGKPLLIININIFFFISVFITIFIQVDAKNIGGVFPNMNVSDHFNILIICIILPFINAVFDFVSIGVTRWCLRCGLVNARGLHAVVWSLIDFGLALIMLVLLGMASMTVLHFITFADGVRLFDVGALFQGDNSLKNAPPYTYSWLYVMLFSTLLPTFLHLIVAMAAALDALPRSVGRWLARRIRRAKDEDIDRNIARFALSGLTVIAVAIPVGAAMLLIHLAASGPLFQLFYWWSEVIGAV